MQETILSLRTIPNELPHEILFIDDGSTDSTPEHLRELVRKEPEWRFLQLPANSGSAAAPRNMGIDAAKGEFLFFLDADDIILPSGLKNAYEFAIRQNCDAVRSALIVSNPDGTDKLVDRVPKWDSIKNPTAKLRAIVRHQSLTCSFIVRAALLRDHGIRFPEDRRIGEDITFSARVLAAASNIGYRDAPARKYVKHTPHESVTKKIRDQDFRDFFEAWEEVQYTLEAVSVSFLKEHGYAAMLYALRQYIWFKTEDITHSTFRDFSAFCNRFWAEIGQFPFVDRYFEVVQAARDGDYEHFQTATRMRLLIAGHDLKFIKGLEGRLTTEYALKYDEWSGHTSHDELRSRAAIDWADLLWIEWLLGAAVWYTEKKRSDQRLVVRVHRSEVTVDYGLRIDHSRVSKYIAVSPHCLGDFSDRFDIPRRSFRLIPNFVDVDSYNIGEDQNRVFRLGIVGISPRLKGFHRAIELLRQLRGLDKRYELHVFGHNPLDYEWIRDSPEERKYYEACESSILQSGLGDSVIYHGWVDTAVALADVGFVLSLSDFEGMHLAPAEGFAAGAIGLFHRWRGVEACYPDEYIFESTAEMADYIFKVSTEGPAGHAQRAEKGRQFVARTYDIDRVYGEIQALLSEVRV